MKSITAGYGDEATWPAYDGHPNDPRADYAQEEYECELLAETDSFIHWMRQFGNNADHYSLFEVLSTDNVDDLLTYRNALRAKYIAWRLK